MIPSLIGVAASYGDMTRVYLIQPCVAILIEITSSMKIQCDMCNKDQASFFCTADDAALCEGCDHRVHHANNLASKHLRFSLHHPSSKNHYPLCDICQERRGFVFCQQDRAILCKECDFPIHSANDLTKKHHRFLLNGTKLSTIATPYSSSLSSPPSNTNNNSSCNKVSPLMAKTSCPSSSESITPWVTNEEGFTSSSISDYLLKNIPGWQVEDFLDSPSSSVPFSFSENGDAEIFSPESIGGIWVPQAPSSLYSLQMDHQTGYTKEATMVRSRLEDDNFIVPQMSTPGGANNGSKRPRLLW